MWSLLEKCKYSETTSLQAYPLECPLAICIVEDGYNWILANGIWTMEVPLGYNWLLHQMDRSRTPDKDYWNQGTKLHLKVNYLLIWPTSDSYNRQWAAVCWSKIYWVLWRFEFFHNFTSVAHPQANGEVEVTNRTLLQGIKARVKRAKETWIDELYYVLWAYWTIQKLSTEKFCSPWPLG